MAKSIYKSENITLIDGTEIYVTPLKIKYLRMFMEEFSTLKESKDDMDAIHRIAKCVAITMNQYCPVINTTELVEDNFDVATMYRVLELAADIVINDTEAEVKEVATTARSETWDDFDLAKLESELFLLGIWKDYEELEISLSMPELMATLVAKRELDYTEKKFLASIQGIDLEGATRSDEEDPWERVKARAAAVSRGEDPDTATSADPNDVTSLVGTKAQQAGFGIGMGLEYTKI